MSTEFQSFYQDIAGRYEDTRYQTRYGRLHRILHYACLETLLQNISRDGQVLEVACGTGHTTRLLSGLGFRHIACDLTSEMMAAAQHDDSHTSYLRADAFSLPVANDSCDIVVSTRFLHLFSMAQQREVLSEMMRVLKPGGILLVDFDNLYARWLYAIPHVLYNLLRYRRLAPYSVYNGAAATVKMLKEIGFEVDKMAGVGGWHLIAPAFFSEKLALKLGRLHSNAPLRWLAEQFVVQAHKP